MDNDDDNTVTTSDLVGLSVTVLRPYLLTREIYSASMPRKRRYEHQEISPRYLIIIEFYGTYKRSALNFRSVFANLKSVFLLRKVESKYNQMVTYKLKEFTLYIYMYLYCICYRRGPHNGQYRPLGGHTTTCNIYIHKLNIHIQYICVFLLYILKSSQ